MSNATSQYAISSLAEYNDVYRDFINGEQKEGGPSCFEQCRALVDWDRPYTVQAVHELPGSTLLAPAPGIGGRSAAATELDSNCGHDKLAATTNTDPQTPRRHMYASVVTPDSTVSYLQEERLPGQISLSTYHPGMSMRAGVRPLRSAVPSTDQAPHETAGAASRTQTASAAPDTIQRQAMQELLSLLNFASTETTEPVQSGSQNASSSVNAATRDERSKKNKLNEHAINLLRLLNIPGTDTSTSGRKDTTAGDTVPTDEPSGETSATKVRLGDGLATIGSMDVTERSDNSGDESSDHEQGGVLVHDEAEAEVRQWLEGLGL